MKTNELDNELTLNIWADNKVNVSLVNILHIFDWYVTCQMFITWTESCRDYAPSKYIFNLELDA